MRILHGLFWLVLAALLIVAALYMTGTLDVQDRLTTLFLSWQSYLPAALSFEQFLIAIAVAGVLAAILSAIIFSACFTLLAARAGMSRHKASANAAAAHQAADRIRQRAQEQHEQLGSLARGFTARLEKGAIAQSIAQAASRLSSVSQANAVVGLWLWRFETDTFSFETGCYCDAAFFTQTTFQPTEAPFSRLIQTPKPWLIPSWNEQLPIVKREKHSQIGIASALVVVPLVVEDSVVGALTVFCHPDVLKRHEEAPSFYEAGWASLSVGVAVAIQGEMATLDRLTGVHNREYFMRRFIQELERANRYQLPVSLLMLDIDNFKAVNDALGHPQGDAVLKIVAKVIRKMVRAIDLVGRYGGEEFIVMLPETGVGEGAASAAGAMVVAERIRAAVEEEFCGMQKPLNLTASLGVAVRRFPQERDADYRDLIRLADEQLLKAKTTGKNKVCVRLPEELPEAGQPAPGR